ncbi:bifunctional 2-polyprenyl-6-hydroxyphenol methylase/3-demethylubiquinol 3-O-methyltransferase UbiG [uncultured Leifsonia sp.]|jgi:SAM-dependent methyltransferase|uniref:class I SAM-dependent methyltransferase n=1 Tax=uncultured Leifsonia sp. TaxID=340359 RepID=UPI0025F91ADC|nr:class I SAM-dependent methyltransferase [uncultured Leifsonia sp.]
MGLLTAIARINSAHPWSHNDAFAGFVLRQARAVRRRGGTAALDVGCGTGNLLARLSTIFPAVVGLEPDEEIAAVAVERFRDSSRVRIEQRRFGGEPSPLYDLIVFVASLHHMPLQAALDAVRSSLRPGGRLVIIGVAKETARDAPRSWVSLLLNPIVGLLRHPRRARTPPLHMRASTAEASQSFDEVRAIASATLPGIRMRRRLFWRYTAVWVNRPEL